MKFLTYISPFTTVFLLLLMGLNGYSQAVLDRSIMPEPGPAPEIQLAQPGTFTLDNGLKVFVVENTKLPRVAFSLILDRKPILEGENAGYLELAGEVLGTATASLSKEEIDERIDFIGASLSTSSSGMYGSSLTKHTDELLTIMSDVLLNPVFKEEELEKARKQLISGIEAGKESPDAISSRIGNLIIYGKAHPYGERATKETVEKVTLEDVETYFSTYFKPNHAYLAVVGDITVEKAQALTSKYFGNWEKGDIPTPEYQDPEIPSETLIHLINRPNSVQSVIKIVNLVSLQPGTENVIPANVMNNILGGGASGRLFQNLREDKAYTYGAYSSIDSDQLIGEFTATASVRNEVTDSALNEFMNELGRIRDTKVDGEDLNRTIASMSGAFGRGLESPQTVARFAINLERYDLPETYYQDYLKNLANVTIDKVQEVAQKYVEPGKAHVVIVGKASEIGSSLEKFGKVMYYDQEGNPYDPSEATAIPEGVDAQRVIDTYIAKLGGEEKIQSIEDITTVYTGEIMNNPLTFTRKQKKPNFSYTKIDAGMFVQEIIIDGEKGIVKTPMGNQNLEGKQLNLAMLQSTFASELSYESAGYTAELTGIEKIDGEDAYVVEVIGPEEASFTDYYSTESGFKIRTVSIAETPQGNVTSQINYSGFQEYEGIMIPTKIAQSAGPQNIEFTFSEVKINEGLSEDEFAISE